MNVVQCIDQREQTALTRGQFNPSETGGAFAVQNTEAANASTSSDSMCCCQVHTGNQSSSSNRDTRSDTIAARFDLFTGPARSHTEQNHLHYTESNDEQQIHHGGQPFEVPHTHFSTGSL